MDGCTVTPWRWTPVVPVIVLACSSTISPFNAGGSMDLPVDATLDLPFDASETDIRNVGDENDMGDMVLSYDGEGDAGPMDGSVVYVWCETGGSTQYCGCTTNPDSICHGCPGGALICTTGDSILTPQVTCPGTLLSDGGMADAPAPFGDAAGCSVATLECSSDAGADQACLTGGVILRGSTRETDGNASPVVPVYVSPFWMDRHEVTVSRYRQCVGAGFCTLPTDDTWLNFFRDTGNDSMPMVGIALQQMVDFCNFAGGRLPTEAQWERAARGPSGRTYPWGEETGCAYANWAGCTNQLQPVGSYPMGASPEGILDLIGNAAEATSDEWIPGGYSGYAAVGVCDPNYLWHHLFGSFAVVRGCNYLRLALDTDGTATMRTCTGYYRTAGLSESGGDAGGLGFRCVRPGD